MCESVPGLAPAESKDKMEGALLLNVIVRKSAAILELLPSEDKALLIRGDALLILDFLLYIVDRVTVLYIECDRLACKRLDKDLHPGGVELQQTTFKPFFYRLAPKDSMRPAPPPRK